ncbi:hypothetical protein UPYG_G00057080, partial [Umbra pygmaea]
MQSQVGQYMVYHNIIIHHNFTIATNYHGAGVGVISLFLHMSKTVKLKGFNCFATFAGRKLLF